MYGAWLKSGPSQPAPKPDSDEWTQGNKRSITWSHSTSLNRFKFFSRFESKEPGKELLIFCWANFSNLESVANSLNMRDTNPVDAARVVAEAWRKWGAQLPHHFRGPFSIIIADFRRSKIFGARDRTGQLPLYLIDYDGLKGLVGAPSVLRSSRADSMRVNWDWTAGYLTSVFGDDLTTAYSGILHVAPGTSIQVQEGGVTAQRFHRFSETNEWENKLDSKHLKAYSEALVASVGHSIGDSEEVAVESSGGIDSAALLSFTNRLSHSQKLTIHAIGYQVFEDERKRIKAANSPQNLETEKIFSGPDLYSGDRERALLRAIEALGYPPEHMNSIAHTTFYDFCVSRNIPVLISGHGGDNGVSSEAQLATREYLSRGQFSRAWRSEGLSRPFGITKFLARNALVGDLPGRTLSDYATRWMALLPLKEEFLRSFLLRDQASRDFLDSQSVTTVNRCVVRDIESKNVWARVVESSVVAARAGVAYRWPLLDEDLIQTYLATPTIWKRFDGVGRYLHRSAISGLLPAEIVWDSPKTAGPLVSIHGHPLDYLPPAQFVGEFVSQLHDQIRGLLDEEKLMAMASSDNPNVHLRTRLSTERILDISQWFSTMKSM